MNQRIEPTLGGNGPPPLPPRMAPARAPAPKRMHGCLIALLVGLALLVPLAGILAAIAIPAYADYTTRAKIMAASASVQSLQVAIPESQANHDACPANGDDGIGAPDSYAGPQILKVAVGTFESGHCGYEIELRGFGKPAIDGGKIWWELAGQGEAAHWQCSSSLDNKYLPASCRSP